MKRVALIAGGWSAERPVSLVSGRSVWQELRKGGYAVDAIDLLPDRGSWPLPRRTPSWARPLRLGALIPRLRRSSIAFLVLHGPNGEDGRIQGLLDLAGIRYTGSGALSSALCMHKGLAKQLMRQAGLPTPDWALIRRGGRLPKLPLPLVTKPVEQGSSFGVTIVRKRSQLAAGLRLAFKYGEEAMLERCVVGRELTVGVLGSRALPVVEIIPRKGAFYDLASKYDSGGSDHLCPAPLPAALARRAQELSLKAHDLLGCRGFSRTDLMLDRRGLWILEVNTLPGMTPMSLLPDAAKAAGLSYLELLREMMK